MSVFGGVLVLVRREISGPSWQYCWSVLGVECGSAREIRPKLGDEMTAGGEPTTTSHKEVKEAKRSGVLSDTTGRTVGYSALELDTDPSSAPPLTVPRPRGSVTSVSARQSDRALQLHSRTR
jgi:hypothetical protein